MPRTIEKTFSPREIAQRFRVSHAKVLVWISSGELRAVNVASTPGGKPMYRVYPADLEAFENARVVVPPQPKPPRRRRATGVKQYV